MARKLNKAKKQEGSLLSRQRKKLESQRLDAETARRDANVAQYEKEKAARSKKKYSSDVNPYFNPRSVREEVLVDYLLDEGFASDEKSAQAIANVMSEEWKQSIVEQSNTLITPEQRRADELKYGAKRATPAPPAKSSGVKLKPGSRMPL